MILILGSSGLVGSACVDFCRKHNLPYATASHSKNADYQFDLARSPGAFIKNLNPKINQAILCSAIHQIDICETEPDRTFVFNVTNTIALLDDLIDQQITPTFCSTDLVFEGDQGNYIEHDIRSPTTEYGKQKKQVEDYLIETNASYLILRMSKLYSRHSNNNDFPNDLLNSLNNNQIVKAANDQIISPTLVDDVVKSFFELTKVNARGIFHVAADKKYSRYALSKLVGQKLGKSDLVNPCSIDDFEFAIKRPKDCTLNTEKLKQTINQPLQSFESYLNELLV